MRSWSLLGFVLLACSSKPDPIPPKRPNNELILGEFERRPPVGEQAIRFEPDGNFRVAKNKSELDRTPHLADGTYKLDGDQLTFSDTKGQCMENAGDNEGTYTVTISKIGIRFVKVTDSCEPRSKLDGQTWWRVK
jgi:hypothetical protein